MKRSRSIFPAVCLIVSLSLTLCACEGGESGSIAAAESGRESGAEEREAGTPEQLPSRILSDSLIGHRIYNGNSARLPQWAYVMLRGELQEYLKDADSGEYTYKLKSVVICNTESYFSMGLQGSKLSVDTKEEEKVVFCVNLDMENRCVLNLADCVDSEAVKEMLAEGAYVLIDGTDLAEPVEIYNAVNAAESGGEGTLNAVEAKSVDMEDETAWGTAGTADTEGWNRILESLPESLAEGDHRYDYYITKDSSVGIFLNMSQNTDSPMISGLSGDSSMISGLNGDSSMISGLSGGLSVMSEWNGGSSVMSEWNGDSSMISGLSGGLSVMSEWSGGSSVMSEWNGDSSMISRLSGGSSVMSEWNNDSPLISEQDDEPLLILELDADRIAAWRKQEDAKRAKEQILDMFLYEVRSDECREYIAITGVKEEYREGFWERWRELVKYSRCGLQVPDEIDGIRVEEIGADAFNGIMGEKISVELPESIRLIGDRAFFHTGISRLDFPITWNYTLGASIFPEGLERIGDSAFEGCGLENVEFFGRIAPVIGERAFADNEELWAVYVPTADCVIGKDAFADCADDFYLVYGENVDGRENLVEAYAAQSGLTALEYIPARLEVNYPEMPLVLTPEVRNFFYGENGEGDHFDSFELSEDAPDYGFEEWHAPCGEFCVGICDINMEASSELTSTDGRYSADNLKYWSGRSLAWAEGVEGPGIGESIIYHNYNQWNCNNWMHYLRCWKDNYSGDVDGYMRYTEICIVNGYAKSQKTWEENGRVRRLLMYVEDRPYACLELEDTILPQYFTLPEGDIKSADGGEITFRFVIEDVYPGTVYEDTCLTGLVMEFTGRYGH